LKFCPEVLGQYATKRETSFSSRLSSLSLDLSVTVTVTVTDISLSNKKKRSG
jgi:hypothetical protein